MKPYGNKRTENITCKYGCCSRGTIHKGTGHRVSKALLRRSRKRARQQGVKQCGS
jgi:hypothetical protein